MINDFPETTVNPAPTPKRSHPILKRLIVYPILALLVWSACSFFVCYRLTRRAESLCVEPVPEAAWGKIEPLRLATRDGEELGGWFVPGRPGQPVVLLLHGDNGALGRRQCLPQAELLANAGYSSLLISMRAHGDSSGDYNDVGWSAREDVIAAVRWLEESQPGMPIVIHGYSKGAAAAVFAADDLGERVHGYILESPYRDLRTAVWNRTSAHLPVPLDRVAYAGLVTFSPFVLPHLDSISPLDAVANIPQKTPVLVLSGGADQLATADEAREICARISSHAQIVVFEGAGAGHTGLCHADPERYREVVLAFLGRCRAEK